MRSRKKARKAKNRAIHVTLKYTAIDSTNHTSTHKRLHHHKCCPKESTKENQNSRKSTQAATNQQLERQARTLHRMHHSTVSAISLPEPEAHRDPCATKPHQHTHTRYNQQHSSRLRCSDTNANAHVANSEPRVHEVLGPRHNSAVRMPLCTARTQKAYARDTPW